MEVVVFQEEEDIRIFPNPVQGDFTVNLGQPAVQPFAASLLDLNGRVLFHQTLDAETSNFSVPAEGLPAGVYYLKIMDELGRVRWSMVAKG